MRWLVGFLLVVSAACAQLGEVYCEDRDENASWVTPLAGEALGSVFAGPDRVLATGGSDLLVEYSNVGWTASAGAPQRSGPMWAASANGVFAIDGCEIAELANGTWTRTPFPSCIPCTPEPNVSGVWFWLEMFGTSASDVYAGGPYGALLHRDASGWSCITPIAGTPEQPMWSQAIWASSPADVFVGGSSGNGATAYLMHKSGAQWQDWSDRIRPHLQYVLEVWGSAPDDVYLVGPAPGNTGGNVVHYDGTSFSVVASLPSAMQAVWGTGPSDVFVGDFVGGIYHYDGTAWTPMHVQEGTTLATTLGPIGDISGAAADDVYAASGRALLHYDGVMWSPIRRPAALRLHQVQAIGGQVLVTGEDGPGLRLVGTLR